MRTDTYLQTLRQGISSSIATYFDKTFGSIEGVENDTVAEFNSEPKKLLNDYFQKTAENDEFRNSVGFTFDVFNIEAFQKAISDNTTNEERPSNSRAVRGNNSCVTLQRGNGFFSLSYDTMKPYILQYREQTRCKDKKLFFQKFWRKEVHDVITEIWKSQIVLPDNVPRLEDLPIQETRIIEPTGLVIKRKGNTKRQRKSRMEKFLLSDSENDDESDSGVDELIQSDGSVDENKVNKVYTGAKKSSLQFTSSNNSSSSSSSSDISISMNCLNTASLINAHPMRRHITLTTNFDNNTKVFKRPLNAHK